MGVKEGELCLMTAALLDREKNCQTVLRALEELGDIPCQYVLCGEGPLRPLLEREIRRRGLEGRVRLMGFRRVGSAALELCYVACGRLDGFFEERLKLWDYGAAGLILRGFIHCTWSL